MCSLDCILVHCNKRWRPKFIYFCKTLCDAMNKSNKITIFSGEETTSAGFYVGPLAVLVVLEFGDVGF